jgi:hypothetical protein
MNDVARRLTLMSSTPEQRAKAFEETLAAVKGAHVVTVLRGHPDPDGIACALAQAHIAARLSSAVDTALVKRATRGRGRAVANASLQRPNGTSLARKRTIA